MIVNLIELHLSTKEDAYHDTPVRVLINEKNAHSSVCKKKVIFILSRYINYK